MASKHQQLLTLPQLLRSCRATLMKHSKVSIVANEKCCPTAPQKLPQSGKLASDFTPFHSPNTHIHTPSPPYRSNKNLLKVISDTLGCPEAPRAVHSGVWLSFGKECLTDCYEQQK